MPNLARYAAATAWTSTLTLPLTAILVRSALSTGSPGIMRGIRKFTVTAMNTISSNCNVRLAMKSIGTDRLLLQCGCWCWCWWPGSEEGSNREPSVSDGCGPLLGRLDPVDDQVPGFPGWIRRRVRVLLA